MDWDKKGWRGKPRVQMPTYGNLDELASVESSLEALPPLVFAGEVRNLREQLAKVGTGAVSYTHLTLPTMLWV